MGLPTAHLLSIIVDMENKKPLVVREGCDASISEAIRQFQDRWHPYSASSRRYPIVRLIEEIVDSAVVAYMATLPQRYMAYVPGAGTGVNLSGIIRLVGLDAMVRVQRQLLRQFIKMENKETARDQRFIATLESLIELIWDCACKRPKTSKAPQRGINLNMQRKHGFCDLCGNLTEFSAFNALVSANQVNEELENRKKLQLSHQYCAEHRPKLANDEWNPAYRQARRSKPLFDLELLRLQRQSAKPATPQAQSGNRLVDEYIFHYLHFVLEKPLLPSDEADLRRQARLMADHLPDQKKKMLVMLLHGLNQSEIAQRLGIKRQAVSKALASVPVMFHLTRRAKQRSTR